MNRRGYRFRLWLAAASMVVSSLQMGCDQPTSTGDEPNDQLPGVRGGIVRTSSILGYTPSDIQTILSFYGVTPSSPVVYPVQAIKIVYETLDPAGTHVRASGAMLIPATTGPFPMLSLHHGTVTERTLVPSNNLTYPPDGAVGLYAASIGYVGCLPDYLGYGESDIPHPYLHASSSAIAVIDFLRAARTYAVQQGITLDGELYLSGYSQGGFVTFATLLEIERSYSGEFSVTATAPLAGMYDLAGEVGRIMQTLDYPTPLLPSFLLTAYDRVYGWNRLSDFFQSPYAEAMPTLFNGQNSPAIIDSQLPDSLRDLMNPIFVDRYRNGLETDVEQAMTENTLLDWVPNSPVRFFHGDADKTVPYGNAVIAVDSLKAMGAAQVELVTIPGGTHTTAAVPAFTGMIEWFESIRISGRIAHRDVVAQALQ